MQKNNFGHTIAGADPTQDEEEIDDDEDAAEMENNTDKSASSKKSNEEVTSKAGKISLSIAIRYLLWVKVDWTVYFGLKWNNIEISWFNIGIMYS